MTQPRPLSSPDSEGAVHSAWSHSPTVGELAPEFDEIDGTGHRVSLQDFRGSPLVLAFSSTRWNPAASEHIESYNRLIAKLPGLAGAQLLRVEHEGVWRELAFADTHLSIPVVV